MRVRIKICGITRAEDAIAAVEAGADALGFMFYAKSPRNISPEEAASIICELPPYVSRVGVFVNATEETIRSTAARCGLDTLQLHGDESPEFCRLFQPLKVVKAFRISDEASLEPLSRYDTDGWLLDAFVPGQEGGTGATFNWNLALKARELGRPIILAGGLNPSNAADAVRKVRPYGLDVSSGVESAPGIKAPSKIREFIHAAGKPFENPQPATH